MLETLLPQFGYSTSSYEFASIQLVAHLFDARLEPPADPISEAISAAGADGRQVTAQTKAAAQAVTALLFMYPAPQIVIEPSGEISLEWYKDRHHLAVLTLDGSNIRWAGMMDQGRPISGVERFDKKVPSEALDNINVSI